MKIKITLPDGKVKEFKRGVAGIEVAKTIGQKLAKDALAVKIDGEVSDLKKPIGHDARVEILTWEDAEGRETFWHSSSHLMAEAVMELFPEAKPTIGPAIEEGFYYDFDVEKPFTPADLERIEKKFRELLARPAEFGREEISKKDALKLFGGNSYKKELISELSDAEISTYRHRNFVDLCRGPHLPDTKPIGAVKLLKVAGAYWRGSEKNRMLQRIYGISFPNQKMLDGFLKGREEAEKRNHLKLGKELDLFSMLPEAPGTVFWHPNGMAIVNEIIEFMRHKLRMSGYAEISTPLLMKKQLWVQSGHWEHYKDSMYFVNAEEGEFAIRPMNCPGGILVFKGRRHSYRDLPIRLAEFGTVYRSELSGVLRGLLRVRKFTQDDAHIFMLPEQIEGEIIALIDLTSEVYSAFGFNEYDIELSTRPEKAMGDENVWRAAETALVRAMEKRKLKFRTNEGEGAFYGPKIDFHIKDSLGRRWQLGTIQLDFSMPERFGLAYWGKDDREHRPVMLHRAILGSVERFVGILIEHYAGAFPLWLSPVQARVITVNDSLNSHAQELVARMMRSGLRAEFDGRQESVAYKVRDAQMKKMPYIITIGEKEVKSKTIAVRDRKGTVKFGVEPGKFIRDLGKEIKGKK